MNHFFHSSAPIGERKCNFSLIFGNNIPTDRPTNQPTEQPTLQPTTNENEDHVAHREVTLTIIHS